MKRLKLQFWMLLLIVLTAGCSEDKETVFEDPDAGPANPTLQIESAVSFKPEGGSELFAVTTNVAGWMARVSEGKEWCSVLEKKEEGHHLSIKVLENQSREARQAEIIVKAGTLTQKLTLVQFGYGPAIILTPDKCFVNVEDTVFNIKVLSNVDYQVSIPDTASGWLEKAPATRAMPMDETEVNFRVHTNTGLTGRETAISFSFDTLVCTLPVKQLGNAPDILVDTATRMVEWDDQLLEVEVISNNAYTVNIKSATGTPSWIRQLQTRTPGMVNNTLKFTLDNNPEVSFREAVIVLAYDSIVREIPVKQSGNAILKITSPTTSATPDYQEQEMTVHVTSNLVYETTFPTWMSIKSTSGSLSDSVFVFTIEGNYSLIPRSGEIKFVYKEDASIYSKLSVSQEKEPIKYNTLLKVIGGSASSEQSGYEFAKSYDGYKDPNFSASSPHYHSKWVAGQLPITLIYLLDENSDKLSRIEYTPRNGNGNFGEIEVWVSTAANPDYTKLGDYDFGQKGTESSTIELATPVVKPRAVKFIVKSGTGGYASCSEMEFFNDARQNEPYMSVNNGSEKTIEAAGDIIQIDVDANIAYTVTPVDASWITAVPNSRAALPDRTVKSHKFNVSANTKGKRTGLIKLESSDGQIVKYVKVTQARDVSAASSNITATLFTAYSINADGSKNEELQGSSFASAIDSDPNSFWESRWLGNTKYPLTIEVELASGISSLDYYTYTARGASSIPKKFSVWIKTTTSDYTKVGSYDYSINTQDSYTIDFNTVQNPVAVRIIVEQQNDGGGGSQTLSCKDIKFYKVD